MKKLLVLLVAVVMSVSMLVGCGSTVDTVDVVALKVWGSQLDQQMLNEMAEAFEKEHSETKFKFTFGVVGEPDLQKTLLDDISVAADVFSFPEDQLYTLTNADALLEVKDYGDFAFKTDAVADNTAASITGATVNEKLYGLPSTGDNTYFLFYDKSEIADADVTNLDKVLEACNDAEKQFLMDVSNGFYLSSAFFSAGCTIGKGTNGEQLCDFDNESGVLAAKALDALTLNQAFVTGDDAIITGSTGIGSNVAACVSGIWNATAIKEILGDDMGVCKLPDIKIGEDYVPWKSFGGHKFVGVKKTTAQSKWALSFASFITNEDNQAKRFADRGAAPTNKVVAASSAVTSDPVSKAVSEQMAQSVSQLDASSLFWTPTETFGTALEDSTRTTPFSDAELLQMLKDMIASMVAV